MLKTIRGPFHAVQTSIHNRLGKPHCSVDFGNGARHRTPKTDWREEYAYTLGTQAYIFFGYPWVYLAQIRYGWVTQPRSPDTIRYAALNHFAHIKDLADASYRDGGSPNQDTIYSRYCCSRFDLAQRAGQSSATRTWVSASSRSSSATCLRTTSPLLARTRPAAWQETSPSSAPAGERDASRRREGDFSIDDAYAPDPRAHAG